MIMLTVKEEWECFRQEVLHPDLPDDHLQQFKDTFYGGVLVVLGQLMEKDPDFWGRETALMIADYGEQLREFYESETVEPS